MATTFNALVIHERSARGLDRFGDWEVRLHGYLTENQSRNFSYGEWDCALFVCGAIEAMTGIDPARWFRGRYHNRNEARAAMREACGTARFEEFFESMAERYHMKEMPISFARRGDMVFVYHEGRASLGIVGMDGQRCIILGETRRGIQGLGFVPLADAVRAWRV